MREKKSFERWKGRREKNVIFPFTKTENAFFVCAMNESTHWSEGKKGKKWNQTAESSINRIYMSYLIVYTSYINIYLS